MIARCDPSKPLQQLFQDPGFFFSVDHRPVGRDHVGVDDLDHDPYVLHVLAILLRYLDGVGELGFEDRERVQVR